MENLIIIWSWPAGHTAAVYAWRGMMDPLMFEGDVSSGVTVWGQLTTTTEVENYPGFPDGIQGQELMDRMRQHSLNSGARIETKTVDKVDFTQDVHKVYVQDEIYEAKTVIIATWAFAKKLGVPWEDKLWQKGISACATCDGALPIFRNQVVGVVWGWDVAMEDALYMTNVASKVILFVRRDQLRASKVMQERVLNHPNIEIYWNTEVEEVYGEMKLEWVKLINNKENKNFDMELAGLFYAIWHKPNTDFLQGKLDLDEEGYILTNEGGVKTSVPWVFAAGDVQDKHYRQAVTSAATGCMAAMDAQDYIQSLN